MVIVVANNRGGGIFSYLPQAKLKSGFDSFFRSEHELSIAALLGSEAFPLIEVTDIADFTSQVESALKRRTLSIIEVPTEDSVNVERRRQISQVVSNEVRASLRLGA